MRTKLNELKKVEREFRNYSNELFKTEHSDGNVYLKKFNNYIHENSIIYEIIKEFDNANVDLNDFIYKDPWLRLIIPEDEKLHYKYILAYIKWLIDNEVNFIGEFQMYKGKRKFNESIQLALNDVVKPLYSFISREIINKITELESSISEKEEQIHSVVNIEHQYNGDKIGIQDNSINKNGGDITQGDNNKTAKIKFYKKEGFWSGVISGIIVGLAVWGIEELIKFLITL